MNPLATSERDKFADHLSYSARAGGWFFIGLAIFGAILFSLPLFGILEGDSETYNEEFIGPFITMLILLLSPGIWLLRRRRKIRAQLDETLLEGSAEIVSVTGPEPYTGFITTLLVNTPTGEQRESQLQSYAKPTWHEGEQVELLFTADETRYVPRYLNFNMNFGRLPSTDQQDTNRRWGTVILMIVGGLLLIGFSIGLYGSVTGQ